MIQSIRSCLVTIHLEYMKGMNLKLQYKSTYLLG